MLMESFQEVSAVEGNNGHGDKVGGEEGDHDAERKRREEILADAEQKGDRKKDDDGDERDGEHSERNFVRSQFGRDQGLFAELDMAEDIFENDDGVIDRAAKRPAPVRSTPCCQSSCRPNGGGKKWPSPIAEWKGTRRRWRADCPGKQES